MDVKKRPQSTGASEQNALGFYLQSGDVRLASSLSQVPKVDLVNWKMFRVRWPDGRTTRHLIGRTVHSNRGRACSEIKTIDLATGSFTTKSGRQYLIHGPTRDDLDAAFVFDLWVREWNVQAREITRPFLRLLRNRNPSLLESLFEGQFLQ
ncbi:hypothetical protein AZ34_02385 [Hylemonella gracilis str. Niagara R]|uniref:Uncharacterized protein n=1 Tax=Hylemonella gracilis str. Niagara R TaxID=1458275 RepID=A0A016XE30_9BURK|nr:hypothetical protein [Hylemonella gracilis]EYC50036.1 hypothetical protein AZ34_02385 [Hylemonella gracilis str. Niagara R]